MRTFYISIFEITLLQLCFLLVSGQELKQYTIPLRQHRVVPTATLNADVITQLNKAVLQEPTPAILQFNQLPTKLQKTKLAFNGIHLLNYLGGNAYSVSIERPLTPGILSNVNARSILSIDNEDKISHALRNVKNDTTVIASIFAFIRRDDAISKLVEKGFVATKTYDDFVLEIHVPAGRLKELAGFPFIEYVEPPLPPPIDLNYKSTNATRANVLHASDYNLTGEGVVYQVNEFYGYPQDHIDFIGRSITGLTQTSSVYHSTHVYGIAVGGGVVNELYKGYAPKARFVSSQPFISSVPANVLKYGVSITNNSWGSGSICTGNPANIYSIAVATADRQCQNFQSLIHVFAAGNSGQDKCNLYPTGYNTVYSGYQSAKSILTVGAAWSNGELAEFSSKGPGLGRIKPEIVAPGVNIISSTPFNQYGVNTGTSMSSPAVAGALGLLYQRYTQLFGSTPENALMKPLLCNSATDLGNPGPDYAYGFGFMNLNRAIWDLDAGNFYKDSVSNHATKTKKITIPVGLAQLKLMLYWQDPPSSPLTSKPIVNDLDIKMITPDGVTILPFVLDTVPALVTNPAKRGVDHINNIEQVVIDNPAAGDYTINVEGDEIGEGSSQAFYIVYDLVPNDVQLTFPASGEILAPGDNISIQWDSWGDKNSTYTLDFSDNNGQSWQTVSSNINPGAISFDWTVPSIVTNNARLRIIRNSDGRVSSPGAFRIIGVPALQLSSSQCPGSVNLQWQTVEGATDYEVMWYHNGDMEPVKTTTDTSYILRNLSEDSVYWFTVRARNNDLPGRRAYAISRKPDSGNCADSVYNYDLKADALIYPLLGRQFTARHLGVENIRMRIKNLDDSASANFTASYSVNGKPWVTENINNSISANSSFEYKFDTPYDFSAAGNYIVKLAVSSSRDQNKLNDTVVYIVRNLANEPIDVLRGTSEDLENATTTDYTLAYIGLKDLERFDYEKPYTYPMLRVGSHYASNPTKCFEFTYSSPDGDYDKGQSLIATYNLSLFDTSQTSVALDFSYAHSNSSSNLDSLFIRGSDKDPWIYINDLFPGGIAPVNKEFKALPLTGYLKANGQSVSSSFQVRWTQAVSYNAMLIDNIKLYNSFNDVAVNSIDSLLPFGCGLSANKPMHVTVQNNGKAAVSNLVIKFRVDDGPVVSEFIPSIQGLSTLAYQFNKTADLSAAGNHTIKSWIEHNGDTYNGNDTAIIHLRNQLLVKMFPHVQDFEMSNGGWYTGGTNSSWEYGTPASILIKDAASGSKAWKTNLDGNYNAYEASYLYAGCYDFARLSKPVISMSIAVNTDSCESPLTCDAMNMQYCVNGKDWIYMPARSVYNWTQAITSRWYNRWHVISNRPVDTFTTIQFRFLFRSDGYNTFEGIGVDDFHVYDSTNGIYEGNSAGDRQMVSGGQKWIDFKKDDKFLASVLPGANTTGEVQLQVFTHSGTIRNFHGQYYLNRNFVFKPTKPLSDSVTMRLYFTDRESDSLLLARNCMDCTFPKNAYRFGISYYKSADDSELDSTILNNRKGEWNFIPNGKIRIVPFMTGYYAEFKVKDAGEFRLSNGGLDGNSDLPVQVQNFFIEHPLSAVNLKWNTAKEINIDHFDIEVARGNTRFKNDQYEKIGEVKSKGRSASAQSYIFADDTSAKTGVRYYRIKCIDAFGNYSYSEAVPVVFDEELQWQVYPNPSSGKFNLVYQSIAGDDVQLKLFNSIGELIKEIHFSANGFVQNYPLDLSKNGYAGGVYILQVSTQKKTHILRLVKQ